MSSIAERLTRAYCLFNWLQDIPIPDAIRQSVAFCSLQRELEQLEVEPEELVSIGTDVSDNLEESRLAFMVRYSGLTWSTCSVFCDAVQHRDWLLKGDTYMVKFEGFAPSGKKALSEAAISNFSFLLPFRIWVHDHRLMSFMVRWPSAHKRRLERFMRLAAARYGVEASVHSVSQSEKFISAIKATVGAQ